MLGVGAPGPRRGGSPNLDLSLQETPLGFSPLCTKRPRKTVPPANPRGVAGTSHTGGAVSKGAAVSRDPHAPRGSQTSGLCGPGAGGTKGGKKGANPLRTAAAPTAAHLLAGRRDRPSSRPASRKASKAAPNERPQGQPRSPRQTQAWPGAWEGAGLIRGRIWLKAPPQEGDPGLIPACPGPSLPTPLGPAGARGGWGRGWDPRSSL